MENTYSINELLAKSPELAAAAKVLQQKNIERRRKLHTELLNLRENLEKGLPRFIDAEDRARKDVEEASEIFSKAKTSLIEQSRARREFCHNLETKIMNIEKELTADCDPVIHAALSFFREALTATRNEPLRTEEEIVGFDVAGRAKKRQMSNHSLILAKIDYLKNAITLIEKMKLLPVCNIEEIEKLKSNIPKVTGIEQEPEVKNG